MVDILSTGALAESLSTLATSLTPLQLTNASETFEVFTGVLAQIVLLPDATTCFVGQHYYIINNSSVAITVEDFAATVIATVLPANAIEFRLTSNGSSAGTWNFLVVPQTITALGDISIVTPANGQALIYNSGTSKWQNTTISQTLAGLTDVLISSPTNNQALTYNTGTSKWINATIAQTLAGLTDVLISSPTNNQALTYNTGTSKWQNATIAQTLSSLTDVLISSPVDGQALTYNTGTSKWINATPISSGTADFSLGAVTTPSVVINGGYLQASDGSVLTTGSGTTSATVGVNLTVNLNTVFGSVPPAGPTTYYLYVDAYTLPAPIVLTDTGRKVINVVEANFKLLTLPPDLVNPMRYYSVGLIVFTAGSVWSTTLKASTPVRFQDTISKWFSQAQTFTVQMTTSTTTTFPHFLDAEPQIVEFYYFDGTSKTVIDGSSRLVDKNATNIQVSSVGLTLTGTQYLEVQAFFIPNTAKQVASQSYAFVSNWLTSNAITTIAHNLTSLDDIRGYEVQEWNTTTGKRRNIDRNTLVLNYDSTNFYLDWTGLLPTATLQYRIVSGSTPIPYSVPTIIGGFTRFVGIGPLAYTTLAAAVADSVSGDAILVTRGYSISAPEVVGVSDLVVQFMPGVAITVTGGARGLDVTAADVHVLRPYYTINVAGTVTDAIRVSGNDCVVERAKVVANNAGLTLTNAYNVTVTANRVFLTGGVQTTAGTVTNTLVNAGTDTDASVRG